MKDINNIIFKEGSRIPRFCPIIAVRGFESGFEFFRLSLLIYKAFKLGNLEVFTIEAAVIIEYLCKYTQNSSLIFVDRTFNVDIE